MTICMSPYKKLGLILLALLLAGCNLPRAGGSLTPAAPIIQTGGARATATAAPERPEYKPGQLVDYAARSGDTLPALAAHFNTSIAEILRDNPQIREDATTLPPGMALKLRMGYAPAWGTPTPDHAGQPVRGWTECQRIRYGGICVRPTGLAEGLQRIYRECEPPGAEIVDIVATNFSISPRALLVLLEYQTGALSQAIPPEGDYPLGHVDEDAKGLYKQLVVAANLLNAGYYGWRTGSLTQLVHPDYSVERPDPWQTAATVAFQFYFSMDSLEAYARATGPEGLRAVFLKLFGATVDFPHIPADLKQPALMPALPGGLCLVVHRRAAFRLGRGGTAAVGGDRFCPAGAGLRHIGSPGGGGGRWSGGPVGSGGGDIGPGWRRKRTDRLGYPVPAYFRTWRGFAGPVAEKG